MRKINVIAEQPGRAESKECTGTHAASGQQKSNSVAKNAILDYLGQSKKPPHSDVNTRVVSTGNSRTRLELVRPGEPPRSPDLPPSTVARPGLQFQVEPFRAVAAELPPLFVRAHAEIASHPDIPLDPDWDRFFLLSAQGNLVIMTMRAGDALCGYIFNLVAPGLLFKSTLHAEIQMVWLDPLYRGTWQTMRWFRANDDLLRELGVKRVNVASKMHFMDGRVASIFRRLGYQPQETHWFKVF